MKHCTLCKQIKSFESFNKDKSRSTGRSDKCRECIKNYIKLPFMLEMRRKAQKSYSKTEKGYLTEKRHSPKRQKRAVSLGHSRAMATLQKAVKSGSIKRLPCERCGTTNMVQGHHEDYSKPLDVMWLCPIHHAERHKEIRNEQMANSIRWVS